MAGYSATRAHRHAFAMEAVKAALTLPIALKSRACDIGTEKSPRAKYDTGAENTIYKLRYKG